MCRYFRELWDRPLRIAEPRIFTVHAKQQTSFPRWELYERRQPPMQTRRPCRCGEPDIWRCWHKTKCNELLGESRR
jgi:hypothetical protein